MKENEILDNLFFIERGYLNANHFVYRSEAPILIDSGYIADFDETERQISDLGIDLADVSLIVNTHTHCDHIGGNGIIQQRSGCDIALHKIGKHFIDSKDDWATWWRYYNQKADFFKATMALEDNQTIAIGPHQFEVIYTPGHASDGIVLYNSQNKILISSDTLWETDMAVMTLRVEGSRALFEMQASLKKIEALDVKMVYPGHGKPFNDFRKALLSAHRKIESYLSDRKNIGNDLLKKITIYTLMMKKTIAEEKFFPYLMGTFWFKETVDLYFDGDYEKKYHAILGSFLERGVIRRENSLLWTTVKP